MNFQNLNNLWRPRTLFQKLLSQGFLVIAFYGLVSVGMQVYFDHITEELLAVRFHSGTMYGMIAEARRAEGAFILEDLDERSLYEETTTANLDAFGSALRTVKTSLAEMAIRLEGQRLAQVRELQTLVSRYQASFDTLVAEYRTRGYAKWGLAGKWHRSSNNLRELARKHRDVGLTNAIEQLWQDENVYIAEQEDTTQARIAAIRADVESLRPFCSHYPGLARPLSEYEQTFLKYAERHDHIGLDERSGLRREINELAAYTQKRVHTVRLDTSHDINRTRALFLWIDFASMSLAIVVACLFFYFLARSIADPIEQLTAAAESYQTHGFYAPPDTLSSNDELGKLARVINAMLMKLLESKHQADERAIQSQLLNEELKATQQQLLQSQKLEAVGTLAGGIAHDFNNILGAILAYAATLKRRFPVEDKTYQELDIIQRSAERGADLTKKLLGYARKGQYNKTVLNVNQSVKECIGLLSHTLEKSISIEAKLSPDLWLIEGDGTQMLQILMNLSLNARDAMANGGTLKFETANATITEMESKTIASVGSVGGIIAPGRYIKCSVRDSGSGIAPEIRNKIFDPFFTTKAPGKGSGLGLPMVYGILQNHRGGIIVDSEPGKGTAFTCYLPAIDLKVVAPQPAANGASGNEPLTNQLSGRVLLIVDDDETMRKVLRDILEPQQAILSFASNGKEAVEYFESNGSMVDCVIMDAIMPQMDGIQAFDLLRKIHPSVPVLFSSGYAESDAISSLRQQNGVGFLQKPYTPEELVAQVLQLLSD